MGFPRMVQADLHLSLIMPGLLATAADLAANGSFRIVEFETLLARSEQNVCAVNPQELLFELFGVKPEVDRNLPVAAVTHALDTGEPSQDYWLRADPVYMRTGNDRVTMMGNDFLELTRQEVNELSSDLNPLFHSYGLQLDVTETKRWYLRLAEDPSLYWHALGDVAGHDIHHYLPASSKNPLSARLWRRILNEAQMILHDSSVNQQRVIRGDLPVNSLWFWGGGVLPQIHRNPFAQVWSNQPLVLGLAKLSATPRTAAPASGTDWLAQVITPGEHLVVVESARNFTARDEMQGVAVQKSNIESLNRDWIVPLLAALKSRRLHSLRLYTDNGLMFKATPRSVARWWKRPHNLAAYCSQKDLATSSAVNKSLDLQRNSSE